MALLWSAAMLLPFKAINIRPRRGHTLNLAALFYEEVFAGLGNAKP